MAKKDDTHDENTCPKGLLKLVLCNAINQMHGPAYEQFADITLAAMGLSFIAGKLAPAHPATSASPAAPSGDSAPQAVESTGAPQPVTFDAVKGGK